MKLKNFFMVTVMAAAVLTATSCGSDNNTVYQFAVKGMKGKEVSLSDYKGKVLLIVNTATQCGFTPQYDDLEAIYEKFQGKGFEILDFPCNQFGQQAPGSIEEIHEFCTLNYKTKFPQFEKIEVNGESESPLYAFLKSEKGFNGFEEGRMGTLLHEMFSKQDPDYARNPDIKWNFTKFLIDRKGNVVARFEPTKDMKEVEAEIEKIL